MQLSACSPALFDISGRKFIAPLKFDVLLRPWLRVVILGLKLTLNNNIFDNSSKDDDYEFNRGKLMNVGFREALKMHPFNCIVFHDIDLMPEDTRNDYACPHSPRHMSVAIDKFDYL